MTPSELLIRADLERIAIEKLRGCWQYAQSNYNQRVSEIAGEPNRERAKSILAAMRTDTNGGENDKG